MEMSNLSRDMEIWKYHVVEDEYVVFEDDVDELDMYDDRDVRITTVFVPNWLEDIIGTESLNEALFTIK